MWSGVNLSLCAVNLGNVAGHSLPMDKLAEMYALMAMTIRLYLPTSLYFLMVSRTVTTCLEMSGILTPVREKSCQGKLAKNCLLLVAYLRPYWYLVASS